MSSGPAGAVPPDLTASTLARLRAGDSRAGRALERLYRRPLIRYCRRFLGNVTEAEDAAADVFLKAIAARGAPGSFRAWLYRIARNHCLNLLRAARRRPRPLPPASSLAPPADAPGPSTRLARAEERSRAARLLEGLPAPFREALQLRYGDGLSRADIASRLGISQDLVRYRLYQGVKLLKNAAGSTRRNGHRQ